MKISQHLVVSALLAASSAQAAALTADNRDPTRVELAPRYAASAPGGSPGNTGLTIQAYTSKTCTGAVGYAYSSNSDGTFCADFSNADSIHITYIGTCTKAQIVFYSGTGCTGTVGKYMGEYVKAGNNGCYQLTYDTPPGHASGLVSCLN